MLQFRRRTAQWFVPQLPQTDCAYERVASAVQRVQTPLSSGMMLDRCEIARSLIEAGLLTGTRVFGSGDPISPFNFHSSPLEATHIIKRGAKERRAPTQDLLFRTQVPDPLRRSFSSLPKHSCRACAPRVPARYSLR